MNERRRRQCDPHQQQQQLPQQQPRRPRPRRCCIFAVNGAIITFVTTLCSIVYLWHQTYVSQELEAPLDHFTSIVKKQFYTSCPALDNGNAAPVVYFPPIYMISARPKEQVDPILNSWTNGTNLTVHLVNTSEMSRTYVNRRCRINSWKSRLFGIYQEFFRHVLLQENNRSNDSNKQPPYIVSIEDDVLLLDVANFRRHVEWAVRKQWHYYSLKQTAHHQDDQQTCLYMFGTVAQILSHDMMRKVLSVSDDTYCRLPIDMYIAQQGPWYVTQQPFLRHVGKRYNP